MVVLWQISMLLYLAELKPIFIQKNHHLVGMIVGQLIGKWEVMYCSFVADPYATVPGRAKANLYTEEPSFGGDDSRSINR